MSILLGIDTGGTFTDAVIISRNDDTASSSDFIDGKVIAKAKSLTTKSDLVVGIAASVEKVLQSAGIGSSEITLVSLSTTLATNALVEGHGGRAAMVLAGFSEKDIANSPLKKAIGNDPCIYLSGAHDANGHQIQPLDLGPLESAIDAISGAVEGFAVAGYFAVRNPAHEREIRDLILAKTGMPVTCSYELSDQLNGPKRALTTLLNARLISMTARLIQATTGLLKQKNIGCPLMVVRGDGSLVSAEFAMRRPIETILSGPAASLIGARWLTRKDNAFVSDIGGTTTDVAVLENGRPKIDGSGAKVGEFQTMVEAVAMNTFGLGGDSEIKLEETGLEPEIIAGPGRVIPLSLLAIEHKSIVLSALERQLRSPIRGRFEGKFAMASGLNISAMPEGASEQKLLEQITPAPTPLDRLLSSQSQYATLQKLVRSGHALISAVTPSDAMHVLGKYDAWNGEAAFLGLSLFARQKNGRGQPIAKDANAMAERIRTKIINRSADMVLLTGFRQDGMDGDNLINHPLVKKALAGENGRVKVDVSLDRPLIGLGASAHQYLPPAASRLGIASIIPEHAEVANAIGAVVGQIELTFSVMILQPSEGIYEVAGEKRRAFNDLESAKTFAKQQARIGIEKRALEAGAAEFTVIFEQDLKMATIEGQEKFIEGTIIARITARPLQLMIKPKKGLT